jgi:beta-xylosidase
MITAKEFDTLIKNNLKVELSTAEVASQNYDVITIITRSDFSSFKNVTSNFISEATIQQAAAVTLKDNKKFFAFVHPRLVSNYHGSLMNTAEEFLDLCYINVAEFFVKGGNPCHFNIKPNKSMVQIVALNEQPNDFVVYNAQAVIDYLKANNIYADEIKTHEIASINRYISKDDLNDF